MPRSPRFLRPHSVIIRHKLGENDNFESVYEETTLKYVKFENDKSLNQSDQGEEDTATSLLVIDCNDLYAKKNGLKCRYINSSKYVPEDGKFSIFVSDTIVFDGIEYIVTSVKEIKPFGNRPEFIEVNCNG